MTSNTTLAQGDLQIDNAPDYGLGIDITMRRGIQLELLWISAQTHVILKKFLPD